MTKNAELKKFSEFPVPTYEQWREVTEKSLKGKSFDTLLTKLLDDIVIDPMYQQKDIEHSQIKAEHPGEFPYTRGTSSEARSWKVSQELGARTPQLLNEQMKHDVSRGQNVYHIVLDECVKKGKAPSNEKRKQVGVPLFDREDIEAVFSHLDVTALPLHIDAGEVSLPLLAAVDRIANNKPLKGIVAADPFHQLAQEGKTTYPLEVAYDHLKTAVSWAKEKAPELRTVLVQTHAYHNGGASPAVEIAAALSTGVAYVRELVDRGLSPSDAGRAMAFAFSIGSDYFSELAKLRAARTLWAVIMKEFGADEKAQKMMIHARTSAFTKTAEDTYVNILRGTSEAFAAAAAGVDSLHVSAFDEAVQESTPFSRRIARNTSLILQEESHIDKTVDPAGGSWYVEHLTDELAKKAWDFFQQIERTGGMYAALLEERIQEWIDDAWAVRVNEVERRKRVIVGINQFVNLEEKIAAYDRSKQQQEQNSYEESLRKRQEKAWDGLKEQPAVSEMNELIEQNVPLSVIHQLLGAETGERPTIKPIPKRRLAEPFESLRKRSEEIAKKTGERPTVYLYGIGKLAEYKARADFITGFFQSGGFSVKVGDGEQGLKDASSYNLVVLCGKDNAYTEHAATLIQTLKDRNDHGRYYIAGQQTEDMASELEKAGVQDYIHLRTNVYAFLYDIQEWMKGGEGNE